MAVEDFPVIWGSGGLCHVTPQRGRKRVGEQTPAQKPLRTWGSNSNGSMEHMLCSVERVLATAGNVLFVLSQPTLAARLTRCFFGARWTYFLRSVWAVSHLKFAYKNDTKRSITQLSQATIAHAHQGPHV